MKKIKLKEKIIEYFESQRDFMFDKKKDGKYIIDSDYFDLDELVDFIYKINYKK